MKQQEFRVLDALIALPSELQSLSRWILWRYETREDKRTKVPYSANGLRASTMNPSTWSSFADACAAWERLRANGIGFVFVATDDIIGVDLDPVRSPATGEITPWARRVIDALRSYTEFSPSGTGFHIILRGSKPACSQCNLRFDSVTREGFEIYSSARYFTVTGEHVAGTPVAVCEVPDADLSRLLAEMSAMVPGRAARATLTRPSNDAERISLEDADVLCRMFASRNGLEIARLYHGEIHYASASDADIALCGRLALWTGKDYAQIDRLFRGSGLMRDKWDSRRGDSTYGADTIAKAVANCRETYSATGKDHRDRIMLARTSVGTYQR